MNNPEPGLVVLFGSGEIAPGAQSIYDHLFRALARPIRLAILETPAGFELNSPQVAGRIADYVTHHLQNYRPDITVIPARHRDTPFSPDNPSIVEPLLESNAIFLGPGSPTYAIRHLRNSLAWHMLQARHRLGNAIIMASAATIASSAWALPVYEIYKVGEDPHWVPGLNLFGPFGLDLVFVPHWDNREGGDDLDTSRAFIGRSRFDLLRDQLPDETTIVGIDEHTALIIDIAQKMCRVMGRGGVTILREEAEQVHASGTNFPLAELGHCHDIDPEQGLPADVWQQALQTQCRLNRPTPPPAEVLSLADQRQAARKRRDWAVADALRDRIQQMGWQINDTLDGFELVSIDEE